MTWKNCEAMLDSIEETEKHWSEAFLVGIAVGCIVGVIGAMCLINLAGENDERFIEQRTSGTQTQEKQQYARHCYEGTVETHNAAATDGR
jgi:1,6-anhydro-N-acetylmuramate kinase